MKLLREFIRRVLLTEATCPGCGSPNAYVGMQDVECDNPQCKFFSDKQASLTEPAGLTQLKKYARMFNLVLTVGKADFATQMDVEPEDVPDDVTAGAFYPDHTVMRCAAFLKDDGTMCRFGIESLGEDPSDEIPITLDELIDMGDPQAGGSEECPNCGHPLYSSDDECPNCGYWDN